MLALKIMTPGKRQQAYLVFDEHGSAIDFVEADVVTLEARYPHQVTVSDIFVQVTTDEFTVLRDDIGE